MKRLTALEIAAELGITLKGHQTFPGHDGQTGMDADICLNGKKVLHVYDSANGGCYDFRPVDTNYQLARDMEAKLEAMISKYPEIEVHFGADKPTMMKENLEGICCALSCEIDWQKVVKRSQKKGILVKTDKGFRTVKFQAGTITNMLKKYPKEAVALMLQGHVKKLIKDKETILNLEYLKSIGVKA